MLITNNIIDIINILEKGGVLSFRTDTLFSLSCDASNNEAVSRIYKIKRRPVHKALPIFVESIGQAKQHVLFDETSLRLARFFWPGPLTLVLPLLEPTSISPLVHRNQRNIAIRIPKSTLIREVITRFGKPIVATSANISGEDNPNNEQELARMLSGCVDLCASDTSVNTMQMHSTIVKPIGPEFQILRHGDISADRIREVL